MVRLYFNKRGELPVSVDTGDGTREYSFQEVTLFGVEGKSVYDPISECMTPEDKPIFWIEFLDAILIRSDGHKYCTITSKSKILIDPVQHVLDLKAKL